MSRTNNIMETNRTDEKDVWGPFANLLAELIEKHANELDFESVELEAAKKKTDPSEV